MKTKSPFVFMTVGFVLGVFGTILGEVYLGSYGVGAGIGVALAVAVVTVIKK